MMELSGKIKKWDDEKGFGFIFSEQTRKDHFFHISSFYSRSGRPVINLEVVFKTGTDKQGRDCASVVWVEGEERPSNLSAIIAFLISASFLSGITYLAKIDLFPIWVPCIYIALSGLTFVVYDFDKTRSKEKKTRVPEVRLHWLSLLGGWPGALFAQYFLRHKNRKALFIVVFWLMLLFNSSILFLSSPVIRMHVFSIASILTFGKAAPALIGDVIARTQFYDNRPITISGSIYNYEERISRAGNPYTVFTIRDYSGEIVAHYKGHLSLDPYKKVSATGVFRTRLEGGGNIFHNQLELYSASQTSE